MKTFVKIFLVIVVLMAMASAVFAGQTNDTTHVTVTPTHYKDLLILKVDKDYLGATVEVYDSKGALVTSSETHKRKMIIDFIDIPVGAYTICVLKNNSKREFQYEKKQDSEI